MPLSRLTSRQWFWVLLGVALVWGIAGERTRGNPPRKSFLESTQNLFEGLVDTFITPGRAIAAMGESVLVEKVKGPLENHEVASLKQRITQLENELKVAKLTMAKMQDRLQELNEQGFAGIKAENRVAARVNGYSGSLGSSLVTIDKGRNQRVVSSSLENPVVGVISGTAIVGRVMDAYPMTSSVRLLTDPSPLGVRAKIIRQKDGAVLVAECFVKGAGMGQLFADIVEKVEVGDLVVLSDLDWPRPLQNFIIGRVAEVGAGANPNRSRARITPAVEMNKLQAVDVILK